MPASSRDAHEVPRVACRTVMPSASWTAARSAGAALGGEVAASVLRCWTRAYMHCVSIADMRPCARRSRCGHAERCFRSVLVDFDASSPEVARA